MEGLIPITVAAAWLIEYHRDIHCVNLANTHTDSQLEVEKLQEEFVQVIHKFVYRTYVSALEGLESDGAGELLHKPFSRIPGSHKEQ
jgi:hypothetical protein